MESQLNPGHQAAIHGQVGQCRDCARLGHKVGLLSVAYEVSASLLTCQSLTTGTSLLHAWSALSQAQLDLDIALSDLQAHAQTHLRGN
jgi:hypothetical protein